MPRDTPNGQGENDTPRVDGKPADNGLGLAGLAMSFSEMARMLFATDTVTDALECLVGLALEHIEECSAASVALPDGSPLGASAHTHPVLAQVEAAERHLGEGPGLDAIARAATVYAHDLGLDGRWPRFGPWAASIGMRSVLALPLASMAAGAALVLYARSTRAFSVVDGGKALMLASLGDQALCAVEAREQERYRFANLEAALVSRTIIGQALGILMERQRATAERAFDVLRDSSQHRNVKLLIVAQELVDTGVVDMGPANPRPALRRTPVRSHGRQPARRPADHRLSGIARDWT